MANTYDGGGGGAPAMPFHPGMLAQLHPNHPIFKVLPGLRNLVNAYRGGTNTAGGEGTIIRGLGPDAPNGPRYHGPYDDIGGGALHQVPPPQAEPAAQGPDPFAQADGRPAPPPDAAKSQMRGPGWMPNQTTTGTATQTRGPGWSPDQAGMGADGQPQDLRSLLMQRFHTAAPQQPALTSRHALVRFLQQRQQGGGQARQPMLPLRGQQQRRPY